MQNTYGCLLCSKIKPLNILQRQSRITVYLQCEDLLYFYRNCYTEVYLCFFMYYAISVVSYCSVARIFSSISSNQLIIKSVYWYSQDSVKLYLNYQLIILRSVFILQVTSYSILMSNTLTITIQLFHKLRHAYWSSYFTLATRNVVLS